MIDGLFLGFIFALILDCVVLWALIILFPNGGTFRQHVVLFVGESVYGYMNMRDDIMSVVMAKTAKPTTTPKQRMNGLLDKYFQEA